MVDVWRPGGRHEERRPRPERNRNRHHRDQRKADGAAAPAGDAVAAQPEGEGSGEKSGEHRRRRNRHRDFGKPREAGAEGAPSPEGTPRESKPDDKREDRGDRGKRFEGKGKDRDERRDKFKDRGDRGGRDRDKGGRGGRESGPALRQYATSANPRDNRAADPNSPFAKLAALKEQLARKD
jgi:ATP-dependent RNA helicase SUPV3L1/SUV3